MLAPKAPKLTVSKPVYRSLAARLKAVLTQPRQWRALLREERPGHFRAPVRWLLGRDLLTYLRSISLYSSNGQELDHRDWMHPEIIDWSDPREADGGAFWFDYLSDCGDGQLAMYSLAYLTLGDLHREGDALALNASANSTRLPRGRFLFVGGDTAYHVADRATIAERFSAPFDWAHADRVADGTLADDGRPRTLLAIPGNHDYYDALLGFNHLFRYNATPADSRPRVADFNRRQQASFVTLKLPFGWWFWGLDTQFGRIDWRQRQFYTDLAADTQPKRLIVATPEPTTAFGHVFAEHTQPHQALHLPRPFTTGNTPPADAIHLDLAGDIHHYARYQTKEPNYASVVAGGGGSFLHPTHTSVPSPRAQAASAWPRAPECIYPDHETSCRATTLRLLCPWQIFRGGFVWLIGAACAAIVYFGAAVAPHTQELGVWLGQNLAHMRGGLEEVGPPQRSVEMLERLAPAVVPTPQAQRWVLARRVHDEAAVAAEWPALVILLGLLGSAHMLTRKPLKHARKRVVKISAYAPAGALALATLPLCLLAFSYLPGVHTQPLAHGFACSVMVLLLSLPLAMGWMWTSRYVDTLPKQAKYRVVTLMDYAPPWIALGVGLLTFVFGLVTYGVHPIGQTLSDIVFVLAAVFVGVGPALMGFFAAAPHRSWRRRSLYALLGLHLGLLQLVLPLVLGLDGSWLRAGCAVALALLLSAAAALWFSTLGRAKHLWLLWLVSAAAVGTVCVYHHETKLVSGSNLLLVFVAGGALTCIWFGWYLAAALAFGGHNNEAGGAARLDRHRHFIRFKLEPDKLTGYVVALDRPEPDGRKLAPTLVDVFELAPRA